MFSFKNKLTIIRDPIHNYIHLNELEENIISTKIFRRLQNIKQTATAYLTYPSHSVDRFSHSLGTLEIMNKIIKAALSNSDKTIVDKVLNITRKDLPLKKSKDDAVTEILIQLFKLAGLLHDVGHLPLSHVGEDAIEEHEKELYSKNKIYKNLASKFTGLDEAERVKTHELVTYFIIKENKELSSIFKKYDSRLKEWTCQIFQPNPSGIFKTIKSALSNDIDADRADYLIRDAKTSGLNFGEYDLSRLIESMVFFIEKNNEIEILPKSVSLSSVEAFLLERYKIYKWLIHQQFVVLTETVIYNLIKKMIEWSSLKNHLLSSYLKVDDFHFKNYIINNIPFDDHYIWEKLREMFSKIQEKNIKTVPKKYQDDLKKAKVSLKILLFREKYAKALFKNPFEYRQFDSLIDKKLNSETLKPKMPPFLNRYALAIQAPEPVFDKISNVIKSDKYFLIEVNKSGFKPCNITERKTTTSTYEATLTIKEPVSKFNLLYKNSTGYDPRPITDVSPLIYNLKRAWDYDMQLFLYIVSYSLLRDKEWQKVICEVKEKVIDYVAALFKKGFLGQ